MTAPGNLTFPSAATLEHLVLLATRAPSVHNTQPWRLAVVDGSCVQVHADHSRQLRVLDPDGRQLTLSCGAVIHHLEVAARGLGLQAQTTVLPGEDPDHLADVVLSIGDDPSEDEVAQAVDILHRHTVRGRFTDEELPYGLVPKLRKLVEAQGAMLRVLHPQEAVGVAVLIDRAEALLLETPGYAEELTSWVWPVGEVDLRADGIPGSAVEAGGDRAEEVRGRRFRPAVEPSQAGGSALAQTLAEHPTLVLLTTVADTPYDWVQAGRALSALLLQAAHEGVSAQPLGQVSDVPTTRLELRRELGVIGVPQMLLRLGRAEGPLETPRRPVGEVLSERCPQS